MKFAKADLEPIPWLAPAREAVRRTFVDSALETDTGGSARGKVYVILRGGYTASNGWYGAYVGSTTRPLAKRFEEHRAGGPRSARGLQKHGIELLYSLFLPLNPVAHSRSKLREWETRLHECLAPVVPKVTGDVAF